MSKLPSYEAITFKSWEKCVVCIDENDFQLLAVLVQFPQPCHVASGSLYTCSSDADVFCCTFYSHSNEENGFLGM